MKNVVFFITHKTLTKDHARMTFWSMCHQDIRADDDVKFDDLWVYNSHQGEISNDYFQYLFDLYDLGYWFKSIKFFDYDAGTHKSLGADVATIGKFCSEKYNRLDRILLLKSDCVLSINYFKDILAIPVNQTPIFFTAPFICAKERITDDEIAEYSMRESVVFSDDITFLVEHYAGAINKRLDANVTDYSIKFTSCYVVTDFSCHFLSVCLFNSITIEYQSWGGAKFYNLLPYLVTTDRCFVVHKYHDIISANRSTKREGPVESWLTS